MLIELYILTWVIAVVAFTYSEILTDHGMILYGWRGLLFRCLKSEDHWLFKILVGCSYCVAGQWMLWIFLYISIFENKYFDILYDPFTHIACVVITVFNVAIIKKGRIYDRE